MKKYELAWSNRHNCTNPNDHQFRPTNKNEREEIIKQHPGFGRSCWMIWICVHCNKVTQGM